MPDIRTMTTKQLKAYIHVVIRRLEIDLDAAQNGVKQPRRMKRLDDNA